jgi:hypothetical protein
MRHTSLQAYADMLGGTIGKRQLQAWVALQQWGPLTGQELDRYGEKRGLWKRLSELKSLGLVEELEPRTCRITGKAALVWRAVVAQQPPLAPYFARRAIFFLGVAGGDEVIVASRDRAEVRRACDEQKLTFVEARELRRSS